ncbi:MAG: primosomal protein N' [Lachnospiraceae bacterium]|nr:primosomal protein N' [Lachnospiraceae bacterium]MDD3617472.1 primosomal protein N' [Lachnospiraceae bacterium]
MKKYANIIVDISLDKLDRCFQYQIPEELASQVKAGSRVEIPFGKGNRIISGYVIELTDDSEYDPDKVKSILRVLVDGSNQESKMIALAAWMKEQYGSTMNQALKTVLPVKETRKKRKKQTLILNIPEDKAREMLAELESKHRTARARLLRALIEDGPLASELVTGKLNVTKAVINALKEQQVLIVEEEDNFRNPLHLDEVKEKKNVLSPEQQQVYEQIIREWEQDNPRPTLIYGITGSGKTSVYMELIQQILEGKKQVIVLIPEIALTYQTVMRFYRRFGNQVSFLNSKMTKAERYDQFERAKNGEVQIIVGPRSALFVPFPQLGMIIIDEEHENTYKSETTPRYHARETAIERARMEGAAVVMGSATPSVEAYYRACQGAYLLCRLDNRYGESHLPSVDIVDLRKELEMGNRSILSLLLQEKMQERLNRGEQIILFLNRRGYAGFVSCRMCGHVMKCPHCDVSLSEHRNGKLICHYCGYETKMVKICPECGSPYISGFKAGTQQIEDVVHRKFPKARVLRMDLDTTKEKDGHEKILSAFANQEADILIGTQMIVKGHDFPHVTLVGVLAADLSLNSSGFRSSERTFQLITQAIGRAGRGQLEGEAVIQTYQPEHYCIVDASRQDYDNFYEEEMNFRELMDYPPAIAMTAILGSSEDEALLTQGMEYIKKYIQKIYRKEDLQLIGPAWESVGRIQDVYRQVIYLKHEKYDILIKIKDELERYIDINSGFSNIRIQFDFNL